jgi:hypothetical protein
MCKPLFVADADCDTARVALGRERELRL